MSEPTLRTLLSTGSRRARARWLIRILSPWVVEWWLAKRSQNRIREKNEAELVLNAPRESERYEEMVSFLLARGLDEYAVRVGSIPVKSLEYIVEVVRGHLPAQVPVRALHIGNFVGVSLCHLSWLIQERHPASIVVSIDPNQPHMGVENPELHTRALLDHFGLLGANLIIRGYTMAGSPAADASKALLPSENVLPALQQLSPGAFDLVLVDGNHDERYLSDEVGALRGLLAANSIVVFDDISDFEGVKAVVGQVLADDELIHLGHDGRVGILQRRVAEPAPA